MNKIFLGILGLVLVVSIYGAYEYPLAKETLGNAPVGTQFGTMKIASINWSLTSGGATTTSVYNNDLNDRYIESSFLACDTVGTSKTAYSGAGLAALIIRAATTTTAAPTIVTNTNYAANYASVATSTAVLLTSSSTEGVLTGYSRVWPSQTYLSFFSNATNTAQCTAGVKYFQR